MAESEQPGTPLSASPAASPIPAERRPAPPPRRAVSAKLAPLNVIASPKPTSVDDSAAAQSPSLSRPRLPGSGGASTPQTPSTPTAAPSSPALQDTPSRPFTPPPDPGSNPGSAPGSPSTIRLQNRHSMINMMKEVRKINTAPTPPVGHVRPLELPIPKPPPSNLPKSVTDDDAKEKIMALAQAYRVKDEEVEAARRIFRKLDVNGDGLISFNDFVRFKFDPVHKDLQGRVATYFGAAPSSVSSSSSVSSTPGTPTISRSVSAFVTTASSRPAGETPTEVQVRKVEASPAVPTPAAVVPAVQERPPIRLPIANATTQPAEPPSPNSGSQRSPRLPGPVSPRGTSLSHGAAVNPGGAPKRPAAMSGSGPSPRGPPPPAPGPAPSPSSAPSYAAPVPHGGPPVPQGGPPVPHAGPPVPQGGPPVLQAGPPVPHGGPPKSSPPPTPAPAPTKQATGPPSPSPSSSYIAGPPAPSPSTSSFNTSYGPPPPARSQPPASAPSPHLAGIHNALAGMDLPDTPRDDDAPAQEEQAPSDSVQKGISFRGVDWEKVNATAEEASDDENKLDDWDKPRDDPDDAAPAGESADAPTSKSESSIPSTGDKAEKRKSAQRLFGGARSRSSKMLSGLVSKLNGVGSKNSPK